MGKRAVVLCTEPFRVTARNIARVLGLPPLLIGVMLGLAYLGSLLGAFVIAMLPGRLLIGIPLYFDPRLTPVIFGLGLLLSMIGGLFSGFFPAYCASRESPADVLRRI